jgi:hypothetical protein
LGLGPARGSQSAAYVVVRHGELIFELFRVSAAHVIQAVSLVIKVTSSNTKIDDQIGQIQAHTKPPRTEHISQSAEKQTARTFLKRRAGRAVSLP